MRPKAKAKTRRASTRRALIPKFPQLLVNPNATLENLVFDLKIEILSYLDVGTCTALALTCPLWLAAFKNNETYKSHLPISLKTYVRMHTGGSTSLRCLIGPWICKNRDLVYSAESDRFMTEEAAYAEYLQKMRDIREFDMRIKRKRCERVSATAEETGEDGFGAAGVRHEGESQCTSGMGGGLRKRRA